MLTKIEKNLLFPVVRVIGFITALFLFALIVIVGMLFMSTVLKEDKSKYISYEDIHSSLNPKVTTSKTTKLNFSKQVEKYMFVSDDNQAILENWLSKYKTDKEKQDYLNNLTEIINKAEKNNQSVFEYINQYSSLKEQAASGDAFGIKQYATTGMKIVLGLTVFIIFISFTILVLILLVLAIERNTRKEPVIVKG